ncbi:MAG: DUF2914 domain-containing protein [Alphaproteobacteria bacterium]|nr:DUF2914 domain-containing protein [Alphaproteobacteria bacterium]
MTIPPPETGLPETGLPQTGLRQTGQPQTGLPETGRPESGQADAGQTESGPSGIARLKRMQAAWLAWIPRYERQLSAGGMIAGFVTDNMMFRRIDLPNTQVIFLVYLAVAAVSILILHIINAHSDPEAPRPRWQSWLPFASQFALGGLWSGFLIFYTRSAVLIASWPFLVVLGAIFIGNELFKHYHSRLAFTAVLFFFALFSYAIVTVPILTHTVGMFTFLLSGLAAVGAFVLFLSVVARLGRPSFIASKWQIAIGSAFVYALINLFWFTGVLPPLPIALARSGVYNSVKHVGDHYIGTAEPQAWYAGAAAPPLLHVAPGEPVYVYSAVFAPVSFSMRIVHSWQHYSPNAKRWVAVSNVGYSINGGRDGGYRAYTIKRHPQPGDWRVDISTGDGRLLGRVRFKIDPTTPPGGAVETTLD